MSCNIITLFIFLSSSPFFGGEGGNLCYESQVGEMLDFLAQKIIDLGRQFGPRSAEHWVSGII